MCKDNIVNLAKLKKLSTSYSAFKVRPDTTLGDFLNPMLCIEYWVKICTLNRGQSVNKFSIIG